MREQPAVSIVLPTYDRLQFLPASVASIFSQSFPDWELIVADDGSGEPVLEYLRTLEQHERVRVLRREHVGNPGKVRNSAIAEARAPLVAFMDSDDLWAPTKLEKQVAMLRAEPKCRWSYTAFVMVDEQDTPLPSERTRRWTAHSGDIFNEVVCGRASIFTTSVVASTELLREVGAFDEAIDCAEDHDLWIRLALRSPACVVDEPLVRIRRYPRSDDRPIGRAHAARDHSLRKLANELGGRQRSLLKAERSRNALVQAAAFAKHGYRWRALAAVARSLPYSWPYPRWWFGAAKALVRACRGAWRPDDHPDSSLAVSASPDAVETCIERATDEIGSGNR